MLHTCMYNSAPVVLARRVFRSGGISFKGIFLLIGFYFRVLLALPFGMLQRLVYGARISQEKINEPPVFILGHFRSGTTLLHKLMASDKRFGVLTNYEMVCPNTNLLF